MHPVPENSLLRRFFAGLTEDAFQRRLGIVDPPLLDYISDLLVRFVQRDEIFRVRDTVGRRLEEVADMLSEAGARLGDARREVHRHIGDFTLFWTGVYPEALARLRAAHRRDYLLDYCEQGKRAYYIASRLAGDEDETPAGTVLQRLSDQFELCAYGLGEVRREWERRDDDDVPGPILIH
jgi:hypothetical protein